MDIITTHRNADFDALASVVGAKLIYPDAMIVLPYTLNPNVKAFASIHKDLFNFITPKEVDFSQVQRLIVVDVNTWRRLDIPKKAFLESDMDIIVYDHHGHTGDIPATEDYQDRKGATTTMIIEELMVRGIEPSPIQATLFLTGIYEDTGSLMFQSTTGADARAAGYCLDHGADLAIVTSFLRMAYNEKQKQILFEMVKTAREERVNGFRLCFHTYKIDGHVDGLAMVARMLRDVMNLDAVFCIFHNEAKGKCLVIGRSVTDQLDMGRILRLLGGGGHPGAAAAQVNCDNPAKLIRQLRNYMKTYRSDQAHVGDLMSFPVITVQTDDPMEKALEVLETHGCTGLPVMENGHLAGVISRRDFKKIRKESQMKSPVKAFMSRNVKTIGPDCRPIDAAKIMVRHDLGRLPVVSEGQLIGIVTRTDVMRYYYDLLPD